MEKIINKITFDEFKDSVKKGVNISLDQITDEDIKNSFVIEENNRPGKGKTVDVGISFNGKGTIMLVGHASEVEYNGFIGKHDDEYIANRAFASGVKLLADTAREAEGVYKEITRNLAIEIFNNFAKGKQYNASAPEEARMKLSEIKSLTNDEIDELFGNTVLLVAGDLEREDVEVTYSDLKESVKEKALKQALKVVGKSIEEAAIFWDEEVENKNKKSLDELSDALVN